MSSTGIEQHSGFKLLNTIKYESFELTLASDRMILKATSCMSMSTVHTLCKTNCMIEHPHKNILNRRILNSRYVMSHIIKDSPYIIKNSHV